MDREQKQVLVDLVQEILRHADMNTMTGKKLRTIAESKTGFDLSSPACKKLLAQLVDDFITRDVDVKAEDSEQEKVSKDEERENDELPARTADEGGEELEGEEENADVDVQKRGKRQYLKDDNGNTIVCHLSAKRQLTVQDWRGKPLVSIREYYEKDGKLLPTAKGISLTVEQWRAFKEGIPSIEKAILKLKEAA